MVYVSDTVIFDKTTIMKFSTNNKTHASLNVWYDNKIIGE